MQVKCCEIDSKYKLKKNNSRENKLLLINETCIKQSSLLHYPQNNLCKHCIISLGTNSVLDCKMFHLMLMRVLLHISV